MRLEAAAVRSAEAGARTAGLDDALARLNADRASLADALDKETARAERLLAANKSVEARLIGLMDRVRRLPGAPDPGSEGGLP